MLLSNEAELLAMEAEKYSGLNPIVVDNNNLTIGLDSGFIDTVNSISGTISGLDNKLDISAFTGYSAALDSGLSNAFETVHNDITELQGDDSYLSGSIDYLSGVVTTGLSAYSAGPNINITDYVISGKDWLDTIQEASAYAAQSAFTGVNTDTTLTGDGSTSSLGVNMIMLTGMLDNAKNEAVASAQSGLIRDIDFMLQNVTIYPDTMSGYNADGTVWLKYHWGCDGSTEASGDELENYFDGSIRTNYISMAPSALDVFDAVRTNSASWAQGTTFTGVTTDSTLTGDGKNDPLGVAEVQSLTSDNSISITSGVNSVILGVNGSWFDNAVNSAVTGAQGDAEVNTYVHNNSATINDVNSTVSTNSGNWNDTYNTYSNNSASYLTDASQFYPMNSNPSGYLTEETDWTNTIKEASANAYNEATALIPDTSNFITNSSAEITYQTIEGMTAYQPTGAYITLNDLHFIEV